jgi:predicted enzyme related to lactoylglutathione lyase
MKQTLSINKKKKMEEHEKINYVEFPAKDIEATKNYFKMAFDWSFEDYGPEYIAFSNEGINGGFYKSELNASTENGNEFAVWSDINV